VIYVFAVFFRQVSDGEEIGDRYFASVPAAMNTLLLDGILPSNAPIVNEMSGANPIFFPLIMAFILLTSVTLMYMLVGVLVEVIAVVASTEKESMVVRDLSSRMRSALKNLHRDPEQLLSKRDFLEVIVQAEVAIILEEVGVKVEGLVDMVDVIYEGIARDLETGMSFEKLIDLVLNMRGTNVATVKDCKEQLKLMKRFLQDSTAGLMQKVDEESERLREEIGHMKKVLDPGEESEEESMEGGSEDDDDEGGEGSGTVSGRTSGEDSKILKRGPSRGLYTVPDGDSEGEEG